MKLLIVKPSPLPILALSGPYYSPQNLKWIADLHDAKDRNSYKVEYTTL